MSVRSALEITTLTDPGIVRSFNEDTIATEPDLGLALVADGMGGYKAGDVASGMAATIMVSELKRQLRETTPTENNITEILISSANRANRAIYQAAQASPQHHGMGTTLVAAVFHDNRLHYSHIGDSRLYRLRRGKLKVLTQDHSILHEQVALGLISNDDAKTSHNRNLVTRALGVEAQSQCEAQSLVVEPGDIYLLCSDGLNDMVDDANIELAMNALQANLPLTARQLVMMANDNGGHDNISAILIKVLAPFPAIEASGGMLSRLFGWLK
ncbi:MAG: Stp1/IreP family PP2C-type Ser/Thr phosphatase [Sulfurimicrobium sp.]|jgi:protein phosphatase|nr:Stp1/IreP family PP2C-type Ser/Thr phosphatase [Sulfurimicrobium sp.]MDZ7655257.1 Stp1/IreP family PP2C-type Ser/Thr phosphatase [Sulfurimicrobium sp.]